MRPRTILYIGNFFFSLCAALTAYILLPYLSAFMPMAYTGLVISGGALVALVLFPLMPELVCRFGIQRIALVFAFLEMSALFALAVAPAAVVAPFLIALSVSLQPLLAYELDLLLEATVTEEGTTGRVRTLFITAWNFAVLISPLLMGALLANSDAYGRIFLASAAALLPFIVLFTVRRLPTGVPPQLSHLRDTLLCIAHDRDLAMVTFGHFLLYSFYIWAPLYVPAYLHLVLGISWSNLGWMFSIMLIPYVLIEYPAGWIADRMLGDKELMFAGFLIAGASLASLSLLSPATPIAAIVAILVCSRVGSSLIESMTEGHFFRRVSERDVNSISVFRGVWPVANLIAPVIGSIILFFGGYQILFLLTGGFVMLAGAGATLFIRDFR